MHRSIELLQTIRPFPNLLCIGDLYTKSAAYVERGKKQAIVGEAAPISCRDGEFLCQLFINITLH